jgi:hypothetical protein
MYTMVTCKHAHAWHTCAHVHHGCMPTCACMAHVQHAAQHACRKHSHSWMHPYMHMHRIRTACSSARLQETQSCMDACQHAHAPHKHSMQLNTPAGNTFMHGCMPTCACTANAKFAAQHSCRKHNHMWMHANMHMQRIRKACSSACLHQKHM